MEGMTVSAVKQALYNLGEVVSKLEESLAAKEAASAADPQHDMFSSPEQKQAVVDKLDRAIENAESLLSKGQAHG